MHRIDGHINDIEPRLKEIFQNTAHVGGATMQSSLSAYGWILLDAWIAWRTLRFLLRDTEISQEVHEKWFSTPSSYTASQLKAIWKFHTSVDDFLDLHVGYKLQHLIDQEIQPKRNASAHFTKKSQVQGLDYTIIEKYFQALSYVFRLYEFNAFMDILNQQLQENGYQNTVIQMGRGIQVAPNDLLDKIEVYSTCDSITIESVSPMEYQCYLRMDNAGCYAWKEGEKNEFVLKTTDDHDFIFMGNKGYYQQVAHFVQQLLMAWKNI